MTRFTPLPLTIAVCLYAGAAAAQDHVAVILPTGGAFDARSGLLDTGLSEMLDQAGLDAGIYSFSPDMPETLRMALDSAMQDGAEFALVPDVGAANEEWLSAMELDADILGATPAPDGEGGLVLGYGWWSGGGGDGRPLITVPGNHTVALDPAMINVVDFRRTLRGSDELGALQDWLDDTTEGRDLTEAMTLVPTGDDDPIEIRPMPAASEGGCGCDDGFGTASTCDPDGWVIGPGDLGFDGTGAMILNQSSDDGCGCDERLISLPRFMASPDLWNGDWTDQWDADQILSDAEAAHSDGRISVLLVCDPD